MKNTTLKSPRKQPRKPAAILVGPYPDFTAEFQELRKLVGRNVRRLREQRGLTLKQLSQRSGSTPRTIDRIEQGESKSRMTTLCWISEALKVNLSQLWEGDKPIFERMKKKKRRLAAAAARAKPSRRRRSDG